MSVVAPCPASLEVVFVASRVILVPGSAENHSARSTLACWGCLATSSAPPRRSLSGPRTRAWRSLPMALARNLCVFALEQLVEGACAATGVTAGEQALAAVGGWLGRHFIDHSAKL